AHRGGLGLGNGPLFPPATTFAALGGREAVARLIDGLYDGIETDALLRPAFARDLSEEREKQKRFFEAWFGGDPGDFTSQWRHGPPVAPRAVWISRAMAARWVGHFLASLAEAARDPAIVNDLRPIVARVAMALVNRPDEPAAGERLRCSTTGVDPHFLQLIQR